ncbi:hypothetical protein GPL15_14185 [Clostridium sp. MCC353]|uniref:uroporphyrinogen decarboxylase family protein n=1 Tax=Clostridium sp. MCC353 TaxID=2592646 RepID=UPI001C037C09|nr:uroporphyrinogen decarboxylase family protein [Clostridium sp. MCC353]MBT9777649.1 hypothetical protein [Clostridium sp. MCC353]
MNSRERVKAALNYEPVDRVPLDATLTIDACNKLINHLNLPVDPVKECCIFQLCFPEPEILKALGIDCTYLPVHVPSNVKPYQYGDDEHITEFGLKYVKSVTPNGFEDMSIVNAPLADYEIEDLDNYPWPDPNDDSIYEGLRERAKWLYENTDLAIVGYFGGSMFTLASQLRGMENWLCDLVADPEFAVALMNRLKDYFIVLYTRCLEECGEYLSFIRTDYDDYGGQINEMISPKMFRELVKPIVSQYYTAIKKKFLEKNPNGKLMKHTCGSVYHLIDDFIEMGIDMLDPIQTSAANMEASRLGAEFKGKIAFHEGIDTMTLMPSGTPEQVAQEVKRSIEHLALENGSGYLIGPVHHLQPDVPPENFIALRDSVKKYGTFNPDL